MHVTVGTKPTVTGTFSYSVSAAGRTTTGYRRTQTEAQTAAREDGELLYLCGRMDFERREREEKDEDSTRTTRRKSVLKRDER